MATCRTYERERHFEKKWRTAVQAKLNLNRLKISAAPIRPLGLCSVAQTKSESPRIRPDCSRCSLIYLQLKKYTSRYMHPRSGGPQGAERQGSGGISQAMTSGGKKREDRKRATAKNLSACKFFGETRMGSLPQGSEGYGK